MMSVIKTFTYQVDPMQDAETIVLRQPLASLDSKAHAFVIHVMDGSQSANLDHVTCTGWFIRADGVTIPLEGTISGNALTVTLSPACYAVPGRFRLSVKLEASGVIHTLLRVQGFVEISRTDTLASPGTAVSSFDTLIARLNGLSQRDRVVNLLDNSDFTSAVNQREWSNNTEVPPNTYFLDRWTTYANAVTPALTSRGLALNGEIYQPLSKSALAGKTLTIAVCLSDGTVIAKSGVVPGDSVWSNFISVSRNGANVLLTNASETMLRFRILPGGNTVRWAALYEGSYTADTLPAYQPKGYATELMNCMRYFRKSYGSARLAGFCTTSMAYIGLPMTIPMRVTPTLTVTSYGSIRVDGNTVTPTSASLNSVGKDALNIAVSYSTVSGISGQPCVWVGPVFSLSADYIP